VLRPWVSIPSASALRAERDVGVVALFRVLLHGGPFEFLRSSFPQRELATIISSNRMAFPPSRLGDEAAGASYGAGRPDAGRHGALRGR